MLSLGCNLARSISSAALIAVLLCACANDAQRTRTEGVAAGVAAGAVAGQALGGKRDSTLAGALIGGIIGGMIGNSVAQKKAQYAKTEDALLVSAENASAVARASREQNDQLASEIAALDESVQQLRSEKMTAESRRTLALANQQRLTTLLAGVDQNLQQIRGSIAQQTALMQQAEAMRAKQAQSTAEPSEGIQRVSASVRDLQQQERSLELARLQLQEIDRRRAF